MCYWKPPTPVVTTEFGLSENDILVSDTDCTTLNITSSFYFERPDSPICEANDGNDIVASLVVYTGDSFENTVIPTTVSTTFNLSTDGYCQWTNISSTIPNDFTTPFKIKLVLDGVKECCEYDIFVDDIQVLCTKQDSIEINNYNSCPGYNLTRVVDNKKSWVQNIETPINRVFAPSSDANIPWRYTNYFEQSGVYENDSRLVLNSKELDVVFNMRKRENPCPDGYFFDSSVDGCIKSEVNCPSGFTWNGATCISGVTSASTIVTTTTISRQSNSCSTDLSIYDLITYKNNFQNYWVKFIEQFIPATTIFVSGEKWSNRDDEICATIDDCGYDNLFTESDLGIINTDGGLVEPTIPIFEIGGRSSEVVTSDDDIVSVRSGDYANNEQSGPIVLENFVGSYIKRDKSILDEKILTLKRGELTLLRKGQIEYQNKFENPVIVVNR